MVIITHNPEETGQITIELGRRLKGGEVLSLLGGLRRGQDDFRQGIAKALDITIPLQALLYDNESYKGVLIFIITTCKFRTKTVIELGIRDYSIRAA